MVAEELMVAGPPLALSGPIRPGRLSARISPDHTSPEIIPPDRISTAQSAADIPGTHIPATQLPNNQVPAPSMASTGRARPTAKAAAGKAAGGTSTGAGGAGGASSTRAGGTRGAGTSPDTGESGTPTLFSRLLAEANVSDTRFARQVNNRARSQRRIELGLARTTVGHWRRGMRPRDPMVAELAAAELSALVGYPVTPADLSWRGEASERDDLGLAVADIPDDTLRTLAGLSGRDMRRRDVLHDGAAFVATAFADPVLSSLTGMIRRISADVPSSPSGGAMIRDMTETFRRLDARFGSSEIRPQVVTFLHDRTRAAVAGPADTDTFGALAELAQFSGWLAQDCNRQALAQRYYIQALTLAEHADDVMMAGRVLSAMSDQSAALGHNRHSLSLARAAIDRSARQSAPAVQAMLQDKLAWALARNGDEAGCMRALDALERTISREPGDAPSWAGHYNIGDVAECQGHCFLLLGRAEMAEKRLLEARDLQGPARARTRAYAEADLALSYLKRPRPELEAALEAGYRAVEVAGPVSSTRIVNKLAELDRTIAGFSKAVAAREWRSRAAGLVRPSPQRPEPAVG
ncbi:Transcriptional regulator [Frankia sp. Hr75.2]|nr:Transcriptional regulator [Frankia sp. Hr75.2]